MFMYVDIGSQVTDVPRVILTMRVVDWFWDVPICTFAVYLALGSVHGLGMFLYTLLHIWPWNPFIIRVG